MSRSTAVATVRRHASAWAFAFVILAITTLVNFALQDWMAGRAPFLPYFPALVLIGLYAGLWPAIVAGLLALVTVSYLWLPPTGWSVALESDLAALVFFAVAATAVVAVAVRARSLISAHAQARVAQEIARETEERLLLALEGAQIGMWSTDLRTGVTHCSDINLAVLGLPPDTREIDNTRLRELVHPDDHNLVVARWTEATERREPYSLEYRIRRPDGTTRWIYSRGRFRASLDGTLQRIVGISLDVTERREADQARAAAVAALHVSEERFRVAQDSSLVAFTILRSVRDATGAIVDFEWEYANKAAARILKRSVEHLVGARLLGELPGIRSSSGLFETYVRVIVTGTAQTLQLTYEADDIGGTFLVAASKLGDSVAVWFMDLTERQALIEELRATEASLREADRQKDEFLATLAHELRNPMAPIRYAAAMIRPDAAPGTVERARQMIQRQSAQMSRLLDDLLDMSRITRNVIELKREFVDLRQIVEDVIDSARPAMLAEHHHLGVTTPAEPVWIDGDPVRVGQVLHNLLHNAIKYTPVGGRIDVAVQAGPADVEICVRDNGAGLAPDMLPNVFKLFWQVHPSIQASKGGLGIGLSISQRLVELHGGTIAVYSEGLGRGAEFRVRLPLARGMLAPQANAERTPAGLPGTRRRVLIVDDNVDAADGLATLLRTHGLEVHVAYRGAEAVSIAPSLRPDIVFLDLGLPDMTGEDVARRLRQDERSCAARFIAITGWGQDADRARTKAAGFERHLVKPVDPEDLLGVIGHAKDATRPS